MPAPTSLALFDFDGTITHRETMPDFVRGSVGRVRLFVGQVLLAPWVMGYRLGLVSGVTVRDAIVRFAYTGVPVPVVETAANKFAQEVLPGTLRNEAMQKIAWHKAQGHDVVVVSGGLDVYLAPWCAAHGLNLLCSSLQQRNGVLTGRYEGRQCVREEKARRIREHYDLESYSCIHAYGDTPEDRDMLELATVRYYRWQKIDTVSLP
ncbi:MAG: HAD family hydrolase [Lysobacteraceae bacterium]